MKFKDINLQNRVKYSLSICCTLLCIFFNSLTMAVVYALVATVYFHNQIIYGKMPLKQYFFINCFLFLVLVLFSYLYSFISNINQVEIVMAAIGTQTILVITSVYLKQHFKL